ncbi:uncharacterized protein PADG_11531 [Paracoccidioides brasiliensis Pb18]|uniref:Uncharacterized protein n=1 Tax=Paracoccidioides brasiliensis (strain Pb18) TaxID=502780 RepID=A0A0A0HT10_PARBD|nr:uncharacterized protein PADG_11531 [Paracoccidioides brasiliensis Pb18]KGM92334.1 hypothetical protein PADG_11531 [Paracoccidioides brasiliensis Pb18]
MSKVVFGRRYNKTMFNVLRSSAAFPDRDKCAYERYETLLANISATGLVVGQTSESPIKMLTLELKRLPD